MGLVRIGKDLTKKEKKMLDDGICINCGKKKEYLVCEHCAYCVRQSRFGQFCEDCGFRNICGM